MSVFLQIGYTIMLSSIESSNENVNKCEQIIIDFYTFVS